MSDLPPGSASGPAAAPAAVPASVQELASGARRRLHPLTPLVRGWRILAVIVGIAAYNADGIRQQPGWVALGIVVVVIVGGAVSWLNWRVTNYHVVSGDLLIESGIVFRRSRRARLDRIQAIDVVRPLAARALGLTELKIDMAGTDAKVPLAYLSDDDAARLRAELLALAAGLDQTTPEAPERRLLAVPAKHVMIATALSVPFLLSMLVIAGSVAAAVFTRSPGAISGLLPGVIGALAVSWRYLQITYGFTLAESPDGLRVRHGLLETRAQTVPPGRVQAVRIVEPLLWRMGGWARVEVNVAGYAYERHQDGQTTSVLLPIGTREVARAVVGRVLPGVDLAAVRLAKAPGRARWRAPLEWRTYAVGADDGVIVSRRGLFTRQLDVMRHEKVQSVRITVGPWQRMLRLATVHIDSTPGPVHLTADCRDVREARELLDVEVVRARAARATATPERWMTARRPPDASPGPA